MNENNGQSIEQTQRTVHRWESHISTIALGLGSAGLIGLGSLLLDARDEVIALKTQVSALNTQIAGMQGALSAMQLSYVTRSEFLVHEQRIQSLEARK